MIRETGPIAQICSFRGFRIELLASYSGILPQLLKAMDRETKNIPHEILNEINHFCRERKGFAERIVLNMTPFETLGSTLSGVAILYANAQDCGESPDGIPFDVKRHFLEYASANMPTGYHLKLVEFDGVDFKKWLGDAPDVDEARLMWAVEKISGEKIKKDGNLCAANKY